MTTTVNDGWGSRDRTVEQEDHKSTNVFLLLETERPSRVLSLVIDSTVGSSRV